MSAASYVRQQARRVEVAARARRTRPSDRRDLPAGHQLYVYWGGMPGECGAECSCGLAFDGFDRLGEAVNLVDRHIAICRGARPDHAARAVDIRNCFPDAPRGGRPVHTGSERKTPSMSMAVRICGYYETGRKDMTPRQRRRAYKKYRRAERRRAELAELGGAA
jgi:hypothetical protein